MRSVNMNIPLFMKMYLPFHIKFDLKFYLINNNKTVSVGDFMIFSFLSGGKTGFVNRIQFQRVDGRPETEKYARISTEISTGISWISTEVFGNTSTNI
jgi:hypothetical protein